MCFSFVPFDRQRFKISRLRAMQWIQAVVTLILVVFFCVWMAASIYFVSNQRKILYKPDRYDHSHQQALKRVDALQYQINSGVQCAFSYPKAPVMGAQSKKHLWIILWGRDAMALDAFFNDAEWSRIFGQLSSSASFLMVDYPDLVGTQDFLMSVLIVIRCYRPTRLESIIILVKLRRLRCIF